jgi:hypothetical protein
MRREIPGRMLMRKSIAVFLLASCVTFLTRTAGAVPITVPPSLHPGDQYRIAFATANTQHGSTPVFGTRTAFSSDIADYNAFVTTVANSVPDLVALGTTWSAIASTATVDARDNTNTNPSASVGSPIFTLDGAMIAVDNAGLWSGSLLSPLEISQTGSGTPPGSVWTGSDATGVASNPLGLAPQPNTGVMLLTDTGWMDYSPIPQVLDLPLYAMSGVLTVPAPEPSSLVLAGLAVGALAFVSLRRCLA